MKINKIPLYDVSLSKEAIKEATDTLKSGWLSTGPKVTRFEKAITKKFGLKYAAGASSASQGLELILAAFQIGPGDQVITSPYTFISTIEAIHSVGAKPVFVDIDPYSLNINPDLVRSKINDRTMAIITVDVGGFPCDYQELNKIAREEGLLLIGDAAHSISSRYKSKPVYKYCDASVLSFHATKNLICGEGGMVLSDNKKIIERIKLLARHGISATALSRKKSKNHWQYDVIAPGYKATLSELHAAVGLGQLKSFDKEETKRIKLAERYLKNLSTVDQYLELPLTDKKYQHGWHLFITKLDVDNLKISRDQFIRKLLEHKIEAGVHFIPVYDFSFYKNILGWDGKKLSHTTDAFKRVMTLPLYPALTMKQVDYISDTIIKLITKYKK